MNTLNSKYTEKIKKHDSKLGVIFLISLSIIYMEFIPEITTKGFCFNVMFLDFSPKAYR